MPGIIAESHTSDIILSMTTAYREETTVAKEGTLLLKNLPFVEGDAVEVIVLSRPTPRVNFAAAPNPNPYPLRGTVLHYAQPLAPAVETTEWEAEL
jgi:hypothetical protein